jgi:hypothetical protein
MSKLNLTLLEPGNQPLNDDAHLTLFDLQSQDHWTTSLHVKDHVQMDLPAAGNRTMRVLVEPANHRDVEAVFFAGADVVNQTLVAPVNPEKVREIAAVEYGKLPPAARAILDGSKDLQFSATGAPPLTGPELYTALGPVPLLHACFLNITAKAAATPMGSKTVVDYFGALRSLAQDRFFVEVAPELVQLAAHSNAFHEVDDALHTPLAGYVMGKSYKTFDHYGNLQLTFQSNSASVVADVDIDDAQGIEHIYQVVRNAVEGPTNPYDIHEILLDQEPSVNPKYDFVFGAALNVVAS